MVTSVVSRHTVCVDGMPRHVKDIRRRRFGTDRSAEGGNRGVQEETQPWQGFGSGFGSGGLEDDCIVEPRPAEGPRPGEQGEVPVGQGETREANVVGQPQQVVEVDRQPVGAGGQPLGDVEHARVLEKVPVEPVELRRSQRVRQRPGYLADYV